jgi:glycosyltransferase involved in cell wall biosynthesis
VRILYHHRTLADGAEGIHIREMVSAFRALGHDVDVSGLASAGAPAGGQRGGVLAAVRPLLPQVLVECAALGLNLPEYAATRRRLRTRRVDLLYKRHALLDVGASAAARRAGVPLVLEVNTAYSSPAVRTFEPLRLPAMARAAERRAVRAATLVVAVSTPLADYFRELAGPELPVLVLPNGANPDVFDPARADGAAIRTRYGLHGVFVVGWAGVLRDWHGIEVLVRGVAAVPDMRLLVIGDGPARRQVEQLAQECGAGERVTITGRVSHDAMPDHLAAVDVAVAAGDRTGFASPMKIVEYMAMGLPVVAPRLRNLATIVDEGRTGLFFSDGDAGELSRCLEELRSAPALRKRLGDAARTEVVSRLNWRANAASVLGALRAAGALR